MISGEKAVVNRRILPIYFLFTPLFVVLDIYGGVNVRVIALDHLPMLKILYYSFCFFIGIVIYFKSEYANLLGLGESVFNIFLLVLAVFILLTQQMMNILDGGEISNPFNVYFIINFIISSIVFSACFYINPILLKKKL